MNGSKQWKISATFSHGTQHELPIESRTDKTAWRWALSWALRRRGEGVLIGMSVVEVPVTAEKSGEQL